MTLIALVKTVRNRSLVLNAYSLCNLSIAIIASMRVEMKLGVEFGLVIDLRNDAGLNAMSIWTVFF